MAKTKAGATRESAPQTQEASVSDTSTTTLETESPKFHTTRRLDGPKVDPGDSGAQVGTADAAAINARVAENLADEQEVGFRGFNPDPTPNENYTVAGVTSGAPTPESNARATRAAVQARADEFATLGTHFENDEEAVARNRQRR